MKLVPGVYLLQGDNGSGKTTFLNKLKDLNSELVTTNFTEQDIVYIGQEIDLFFKLSIFDNISMFYPHKG